MSPNFLAIVKFWNTPRFKIQKPSKIHNSFWSYQILIENNNWISSQLSNIFAITLKTTISHKNYFPITSFHQKKRWQYAITFKLKSLFVYDHLLFSENSKYISYYKIWKHRVERVQERSRRNKHTQNSASLSFFLVNQTVLLIIMMKHLLLFSVLLGEKYLFKFLTFMS